MAQNVTLLGASYADVPAVQLPKTGGGTALFADPSGVTAVASDVAQGKIFMLADGSLGTGTASGGGSGVTKVAETSYQVSTTSTSAATVATWATGHSEIWASDKLLYIKIRDTAGKRNNYFYGTDNFFLNTIPINGSGTSSFNSGSRYVFRYDTDVFVAQLQSSTNGYGVFADTIYSDGRIRIRSRYNATYAPTVNGTYKIEVYLIDVGTLFA